MNTVPKAHLHVPDAVVSRDLEALRLPTPPVAPSTSVLDVAQRILEAECAGLLSLVIVDGHRPVGIISRYELMRVLLMPYGRELYGRRPITSLMNQQPLVLPVTTPLDHAARAIATHIRSPITDDFVLVDEQGGYLGTGLVLDVLRSVESRLSERGTELERAYARLKSSQMQLVQSEKMASLGQMVAGLVHEINTPLGYVRNNVEMTRAMLADALRLIAAQDAAIHALDSTDEHALRLALTELESTQALVDTDALADLEGLLDDTVHGIGQISELVTNLKDFSRLDQSGLQRADVNRLLDSALKIVQHLIRKNDVDIVRDQTSLPEIECAPAQINQVLLNLLGNAIQAITHDHGRIVVRTRALDQRVVVAIEDNGKGIAADVLPRIFDPFFTTKPAGQGTGMGLAISHQIIEQHGGLIRAYSHLGKGTRFVVALPLAAKGIAA